MIRVYLLDDHEVVRHGLRDLLEREGDIEVVGESGSAVDAEHRIPALRPDVAVLDLSMPGLTGSQATERLRTECPQVKVLALTVHEHKVYIRQLLAAGAAGYVLRRGAPEELLRAIRVVAAGGVYLDPTMAGKVVGGFVGRPAAEGTPAPAGALSDRETEVARMTVAGHSNKEIAGRLDLSVKTVETYRARALEKLGLQGRADLVRYAVQQGWLQDG